MVSLSDPITKLRLVGPASEQALNRLGMKKVGDLLQYFPRAWQDRSQISPIASIRPNQLCSIRAKVRKVTQFRSPRRRLPITQAILEDESGSVVAVWFNQPFLKNTLIPGREYYFFGKGRSGKTLELHNPAVELARETTVHSARIVPLYDLTAGLSEKQLRYWLTQALPARTELADDLPAPIRKRHGFLGLSESIAQIHFPENWDLLERARQRLAFDELFLFQLALLSHKKKIEALPAPAFPFHQGLIKKFVSSLPFALTRSQRLAAWEILRDLEVPHPMNRLLEGEVGSGKTVVAGIAMLEVAEAGYQSVLLAPTEILAWQHYQTLKKLYANTKLDVLISTRFHRPTSYDLRAPIIVGTHALLQENVRFDRIGLLVIDEQHRFGVKQRAALTRGNAGLVPHLLSMTATPIPRTLALAFYGDLSISQLRQLPSGRKKIITRLVSPENRSKAYEFIRKELVAGRQAYVVVPLIEITPHPTSPTRGEENTNDGFPPLDGEGKGGVKSVTDEAKKLQKIFPEFRVAILHGRMSGEEKKQVMTDFQTGHTHILVATTVIEVGVDVPNATIILIENAERFGLAQLHQLRGRVGRSNLQSYCLFFAEVFSEITKKRLQAVVESNDGFALAETDLALRGAGEIMGTAQSGFMPLRIARLSDTALIKLAKSEAARLLDDDNLKNYPALRQKVNELAASAHLE